MQTQTDSDLIAAYAHSGDQNSFAELVSRHQRMVYRVCQRMLRHHQEAEDATQAVFLVMLHKANGLTRKGELTGWLYGVARNVALEALRKRARRQEEAMLDETETIAVEYSADHETALQSVDQELAGLSGVLRQAVVLRYLQGYNQAEAARQAGCSMGTLASRASRGIERLRQRLAKRGVALSGVALAGLLTSEASAAVPETLLPSILATVKTAVATTATGTALPGVALGAKTGTTTAAMLAKGAMKAMFIAKVKMVAAVAAAVVVTGTAVPVGIAVAQAVGKDAKLAGAGNGELKAADGNYLVIDLSGGPSASNYPVGYLSAVPPGGWTDEYKTTKLVMRKIPAGTFTMGSPSNELGRTDGETQHSVTLTHDFHIGVFEVTQCQWELVMGNRPSYFNNATYYASRPVEQVSYYDIRENPDNSDDPTVDWPTNSAVNAMSFMGKLRAKTGLTTFDLPTYAHWEYACRADTTTELNSGKNLDSGDSDANMTEVGRYKHNGGSNYTQNGDTSVGTAEVGSYLPNAYGLYDMHGNVSEWCLDCDLGSLGTASGPYRLIRGGGWSMLAYGCRSAACYSVKPDSRGGSLGFRAAMTLP